MSEKVYSIAEVISRVDEIKIDFANPSKQYHGATFYKMYLDPGVPLVVYADDEVVAGQINPLHYADVVAINQRSKYAVRAL